MLRSLARSGGQLTNGVFPECEPSLLQPWKTVHHTVSDSLGARGLSRVYKGHVGERQISDSRNSTAC